MDGSSGSSGVNGLNGSSGSSGVNGLTGSAGTSGSSGSSGVSGNTAGSFGIVIDGGGSNIATGNKGYVEIPYSGTITGWTIIADAVGGSPSCVVDVQKTNYAGFAAGSATPIAGSEKPTITVANYVGSNISKNQDNNLTTWTTSVSAGDIIIFNLDSCTFTSKITLSIKITKS